jgi:hypothetical protein
LDGWTFEGREGGMFFAERKATKGMDGERRVIREVSG